MGNKGKANLGTPWLWYAAGRGRYSINKGSQDYAVSENTKREVLAYANGEIIGTFRSVRQAARACVRHYRMGLGNIGVILFCVLGLAGWAFSQGVI